MEYFAQILAKVLIIIIYFKLYVIINILLYEINIY